MPIIFFGTPDFAVPSLKKLIALHEPPALVISQPDRRTGRKKQIIAPPVKALARENGIKVMQPVTLRESTLPEELRSIEPEFIIVVAYGRILPESILNLPAKGCINVHASLLPAYRGAAPIQWALIKGEETTGVTTMLMDSGLDTGDILLQKKITIEKSDNAKTLSRKLSLAGAELLIETILGVREERIEPRPQEGEYSYAPILKKNDGRIDWSQNGEVLFNFVRGMFPWPCAFSYVHGNYLKILEADPGEGTGQPGKIMSIHDEGIHVGTGQGLLSLKTVQPEGKKPMHARAFAHGYRIKEGDTFE